MSANALPSVDHTVGVAPLPSNVQSPGGGVRHGTGPSAAPSGLEPTQLAVSPPTHEGKGGGGKKPRLLPMRGIDPRVAERLRDAASYRYAVEPHSNAFPRGSSANALASARPPTTLRERFSHAKLALAKTLHRLRYETDAHYYVTDLRNLLAREPQWGDSAVRKVGCHMKAEFFDCDDNYRTRAKAEQSIRTRLHSDVAYETTYATYRLKTNRWTGKTSPGFVGTISTRKFDNPPMPKFGEGWIADFVTAPLLRHEGHGMRIWTVAEAEMHKHPAPAGQARLYTEDHNIEMYERMGATRLPPETILDDKGEALVVTPMLKGTALAESRLPTLGIERLAPGQR